MSQFAFVTIIKTLTKSSLEWKGFMWLKHPYHSPSLKEVRVGTQEQRQESGRDTAYWFAHRLTFSCLSYTAQAHLLRDGSAHS